jgi:hypothetical protein
MRPHSRVFPSQHRIRGLRRRKIPMCALRVTISRRLRQELERQLHTAQHSSRLHDVTCLLAILTDGAAAAPLTGVHRIATRLANHPDRGALPIGTAQEGTRRGTAPYARDPALVQRHVAVLADLFLRRTDGKTSPPPIMMRNGLMYTFCPAARPGPCTAPYSCVR